MSANLATKYDGTAMMAYREDRGMPWHQLGAVIRPGADYEEVLQVAGLDWEAEKRALSYHGFDGRLTKVPNRFAVVRRSDGQLLGPVVGKSYEVVQNRDAFAGVAGWLQDGVVQIESAGALGVGERVWMLIRLDEDFLVGGVDPVSPYALMATSHDGTSCVTARLTDVRVVCQNTLTAALDRAGTQVKIRHTRHAQGRIAAAGQALELTSRRHHELMQAFERMAQSPLPSAELIEKVADVVSVPPAADQKEIAEARHKAERLQLWRSWNAPSVKFAGGQDNNWGVYNWATHFIDWVEDRRDQDVSADPTGKALEKRALFSLEGFGSDRRQKVFDLLSV